VNENKLKFKKLQQQIEVLLTPLKQKLTNWFIVMWQP